MEQVRGGASGIEPRGESHQEDHPRTIPHAHAHAHAQGHAHAHVHAHTHAHAIRPPAHPHEEHRVSWMPGQNTVTLGMQGCGRAVAGLWVCRAVLLLSATLLCHTLTLCAATLYLAHCLCICVCCSFSLSLSLSRARARTPAERARQGKGKREPGESTPACLPPRQRHKTT